MLSSASHFVRSESGFNQRDLAELRDFLRAGRERLRKNIRLPMDEMSEVHVVLGNESADMDSVVSAILRAYHLSLSSDNIYLPYISISREELALRRDVLYLFDMLGISADDVSFMDDELSLDVINKYKQLKLHLVDHNELNPDLAHLSDTVVDIIDHHADTQRYPDLQQKIIETIGSCTTLVANELLKTRTLDELPAALAAFMLAPVLMDTDNLTSKEKTRPKDVELSQQLIAKMGDKLPPDFYKILQEKKADVSNFSNRMRLLKDFKKSKSDEVVFGMSSLGASSGFWMENEAELLPDFEKLATEKDLDFLLLLMPYHDAGKHPQRKIVVYSRSPGILTAFNTFARENEFLKTKTVLSGQSANICFYSTADFMSRKDLEPKIRDVSKNETFKLAFATIKQQEMGKVPAEPSASKKINRRISFLNEANTGSPACSSSSAAEDSPPAPKHSRMS